MAFLVGAITTQYFHTDIFTSISVIVLSVISSILPDICHTQSKIGGDDLGLLVFCQNFIWS